MRCLPFVLVAVAASASGAAPTGTHSDIIGGTATNVGDWPSVVVIEVGHGLCTGTLLTPDWVITAAHCLTPSVVGLDTQQEVTGSARIHFNTVDFVNDPGTEVRAQETFPDPFFNPDKPVTHDTGLIHLASSVNNVTPIPFNWDPAKAPIGITVTEVGYGVTGVGPSGMPGKQFEVNQTSVSCDFIGSGATNDNLLCFDQKNGTGKCEGDSGGPSFAMIDGQLTQVGITSFGDPMCAKFGGDTRTDAARFFIISHVPEAQGVCTAETVDAVCGSGEDCDVDLGHCEPAPFTTFGLGTTCTSSLECASGQCADGPDGKRCTTECTRIAGPANSSCPDGFNCLDTGGDIGACWPDGGCCSGSRGAPTMVVGAGVVMFGLKRRRRSRRRP